MLKAGVMSTKQVWRRNKNVIMKVHIVTDLDGAIPFLDSVASRSMLGHSNGLGNLIRLWMQVLVASCRSHTGGEGKGETE